MPAFIQRRSPRIANSLAGFVPGAPPSSFKAAWAIGSNILLTPSLAMQKNVAGQKIGAQLVSATDGSAFTGSVTVSVTGDAGTQATGSVGSGACTHEGNGYHTYAPAQAETNYTLIAFTFTGTGAVPVTVQVETSVDANMIQILGTAVSTPATAGILDINLKNIANAAVSTSTAQLGVNIVNAAGTAWNSGAITSGTLATDSLTSTAAAASLITEIQTGLSTLTQSQVTGGAYALNSSSFAFNSTLDFTTTQKAATLARVTLTDTLTTYTGNTPQTGDSFARIGATGSGLTSITSLLPTALVGGRIDASVGAMASSVLNRAAFAADTGLQSLRSGTAQASNGDDITLDAGASSVNGFYTPCIVRITGGTGAGQSKPATAYVGATKVLTLDDGQAFQTTPDNTSTFALLPCGFTMTQLENTAFPPNFGLTAIDGSGRVTPDPAAIWQDTTAGDFDVPGSIGKSLNPGTLGTAPGASGGLALVGSAMALTSGERNSTATALLDLAAGIETGVTLRQSIRAIAAACAGKRSGSDTLSEQFDAIGNPGTARIITNADSAGDGTPTLSL